MVEPKKSGNHIDDVILWQWGSRELESTDAIAVQEHAADCARCRRQAEAIGRLIETMQSMHSAVQPTLAEQMQLLRALEAKFTPAETKSVLVAASQKLVRWLAPAVAVLTLFFALLRREAEPASEVLSALLPEAPEWRLIVATDDEQLQQAMLELGLSNEGSIK